MRLRRSAAVTMRRLQFLALRKLALPLLAVPLMLVMKSWRKRVLREDVLEELIRSPHAVLATCHGMFLHLLSFSSLVTGRGRKLVVMLSPSLDGRLLASLLSYFDIDHVLATSGANAVGGSLELIRRIRAGDIAVVAVDGPRGPCFVAKEGFLTLANAADAPLFLAMTSGRAGLKFGSWDRAHLPLPFTRVSLTLVPLRNGDECDNQESMREVQDVIDRSAPEMHSRASSASMRSSAPS